MDCDEIFKSHCITDELCTNCHRVERDSHLAAGMKVMSLERSRVFAEDRDQGLRQFGGIVPPGMLFIRQIGDVDA